MISNNRKTKISLPRHIKIDKLSRYVLWVNKDCVTNRQKMLQTDRQTCCRQIDLLLLHTERQTELLHTDAQTCYRQIIMLKTDRPIAERQTYSVVTDRQTCYRQKDMLQKIIIIMIINFNKFEVFFITQAKNIVSIFAIIIKH